ncbi:hypothetical protein N7524_000105 [Penicillium chrysogenum]|nr:hypothetical protein N7524_000105 [Penicillium chrysogenum]
MNHFDHTPLKTPSNNDIHQSDRGGLRLQDNRLTSDNNHFDYPPQSTNSIPTSLTVAGFAASGQSGDCFRTIGRLVTTTSNTPNNIHQSDRGGLRSFRTIGRLLQYNRETGDNNFEYPPRSTTSINNIHQSDRGGLHSFRTIGGLVTTTSITSLHKSLPIPSSKPPQPTISISLIVAGFIASGQLADW